MTRSLSFPQSHQPDVLLLPPLGSRPACEPAALRAVAVRRSPGPPCAPRCGRHFCRPQGIVLPSPRRQAFLSWAPEGQRERHSLRGQRAVQAHPPPPAGPYSICFRAREKFSRAVLKACSKKAPSSLLVS